MRRSALPTTLLTILGVALTAVAPCTTGPSARTFAKGSLVIPMDNCYQKRDGSAPNQTVACNASADDGILRAYGLVYFLLKHDVTVYWAIDDAKGATTAPDLVVTPSSPSAGPVVKKLDWSAPDAAHAIIPFDCGGGSCPFPDATPIRYIGGPFVIDAADAPAVLQLLLGDPDFAQFRNGLVDVHELEYAVDAPQVRPLSHEPPKIAILNIAGPKTSADVMIKYARAAGFDWSCSGACTRQDGSDCDCAGGISKKDTGCTKASIQSKYGITVNDGPGKVYDILCDKDFLPAYANGTSDFSKATLLDPARSYKLLWAPHWESPRSTCPQGTVNPSGKTVACGTQPDAAAAVGTPQRNLADTLTSINAFVGAGNHLFAECHAIVTLEGGYGLMDTGNPIKEYGLAPTRFQATSGMSRSISTALAASAVAPSWPGEPFMQIGDFAFANVSGNVSAYLPDPNGNPTFGLAASGYLPEVRHFLAQTNGSPNLDVFTELKATGENATGGAVIYLGGHDYSSQSAGTRVVLNTLFNLGFACADPKDGNGDPVTCNTGQLGECSIGYLKCAQGGSLVCAPQHRPVDEVCNDGKDNNCDGRVDEGCVKAECTKGTTRACAYPAQYANALGKGACKAATQTCDANGFWGPCSGEVLPQPEVCNGKDDDCSGTVDDGKLCPAGATCTNGVCLPDRCGLETAGCPAGYTCIGSQCQADACPTPCAAGTVCLAGACKDPCADVRCGAGDLCSGGQCFAGGCALSGCAAGETCLSGACVEDPCAGNVCPQGTLCRAGDCVRSCAYVECPAGQSCGADGFCEGAAACSPACAAGQVCVNGACQSDPCAGVTCGVGRVCSAGACVDAPCAHVQCAVGRCVNGQCTSSDVVAATQTPMKPAAGGCGSGGAGDLASLALALAAVLRRRRAAGLRAVVRRAARPMAALAALALALGGAAGCSKSSACPGGQVSCGGACADLQASNDHCGACGHACNVAGGFACSAGSCAFPTGNPYLASIDPPVLGAGNASAALTLTGSGFMPGAAVRFTGAGLDGDFPPCPAPGNGPTTCITRLSETSATVTLDASSAATGATQVRVLNKNPAAPPSDPNRNRLVSNAVSLPVATAAALVQIEPSGLRQDQLATTTVALTGAGFAAGAVVAVSGPEDAQPADSDVKPATLTLTPAGTITDTGLSVVLPATLAVGTYSVVVSTPTSAPSRALKLRVNEAPPALAAISPTSSAPTALFGGSVTGTNFYPTSVVRVTGGPFTDTPLETRCHKGVDATGRCKEGDLFVSADLTSVPPGTAFGVVVVNPGSPPATNAAVRFQVTVP